MSKPETALETYKAIIDLFVNETRLLGGGSQIKKRGIYSKAPAHARYNEFIESLTDEQKDLLSDMLIEERSGTIHDVLAKLEWWITCREVALTCRGEPLPVEFAEGMHCDYVGRCNDWEWPK